MPDQNKFILRKLLGINKREAAWNGACTSLKSNVVTLPWYTKTTEYESSAIDPQLGNFDYRQIYKM